MFARDDLQQLALLRLGEARALADAGFSSGAYYLAGYSIELGLKVLIASKFVGNEIPDKGFVNAIYTHDLERLVLHAGLLPACGSDSRTT
jgi:hypothetical protein